MEVGGALVSVLFVAFSLPCLLLLLVLGEAGLRVAALALRGGAHAWAWPTRSAFLGYRIARHGGGGGGGGGGGAGSSSSSSPYSYLSAFRDDEEPPLPRECCDRLAVAVYRRRDRDRGTGPEPECAFCLSAVRDGEEVRELRCRHVFHRACLDAWLVRPRATCPLCRERLLPPASDSQPRTSAAADGYSLDDDGDHYLPSSSSSASAYAHGGAPWHMT